MVRQLALVVLTALFSATVVASGDAPRATQTGAQATPKPAAPRPATQKPAPKPAAPAAAKPELPPPPPPPATDVRMKTASTQGAQVSQNTTYLQGARQRGACDKSPMKIEVDAWYVDLPPQSGCTRAAAAAPAA